VSAAAQVERLREEFNHERQHGGRVVIVGFVAGDRGRRKNYFHGSAKAGLATYAEGSRARLFPAGATVTLIKPGVVNTLMTWGLPGLFFLASPKDCAAAIIRTAVKCQTEVYHPFFWRSIMPIIRHVRAFVMAGLTI